jgi:multidrug efflux pump subunit AcrA (membrane-fusion protein)
MYGYATINLPSVPGALRIPLSALVQITTDALGTVHVVKDGVVRSVKVRVGRDDGLQTEVYEGLSADDLVVIKHSAELVDGTKVNAVFAKDKASPKSPNAGKKG